MYFAQISRNGPVKPEQVPDSIGVLEALDKFMPIGQATCCGCNNAGLAWWTLKVHGRKLPGRWIIIDRQFRPT